VIDDIVTARTVLAFLGRHGTTVMPAGIVIGLLFPALTDLARPLAEPLVLLMFAVSIYRLDPAEIRVRLRRPGTIGLGILWVLSVIPIIVFTIGYLIGLPAGLLVVLVAWSACPPLVTIPGLALLLGLDGAAALLIMAGATILFPLTLPLALALFIGDGFGGDPVAIAGRLLIVVLGCCAVGQGARFVVGETRARRTALEADGFMVILLAVFAVTVMGGLHRAIHTDIARIPLFVITAFCASGGLQLLAAGIFRNLPRSIGGALALASGNRNFALLLPAVGSEFAEDMWLYLGAVQFPIYILPMLSKPLYRLYRGKQQNVTSKTRDKRQ
jgi:predicted Na+-dependent transporter